MDVDRPLVCRSVGRSVGGGCAAGGGRGELSKGGGEREGKIKGGRGWGYIVGFGGKGEGVWSNRAEKALMESGTEERLANNSCLESAAP